MNTTFIFLCGINLYYYQSETNYIQKQFGSKHVELSNKVQANKQEKTIY